MKANFIDMNVCVLRADYQTSSWRNVIISMIAYGFAPVIIPTMILLSKLLKKPIKFFPFKEKI
jgi:hypothetical protein